MQTTILQKIVADKRLWIEQKQALFALQDFFDKITPSTRNFYEALKGAKPYPAFILECKKASPSKGVICDDFDPQKIAKIYAQYATVISVLTDTPYFQGDFAYLALVQQNAPQPILCKDFIISEYQIYLARYFGADAVLLMLSILNDEEYRRLSALAHSLQMGVLTEVATVQETTRAVALKAKVIGINNRNLHDLSIDTKRSLLLARHIPKGTLVISESGIYHRAQIDELGVVADGFLVGSALMACPDLQLAVRRLVFGEHKVCGLTQSDDVKVAYRVGATYGGLIFAQNSSRCISEDVAYDLVKVAPLKFVGVFQDQDPKFVAHIASRLGLFAVQLHGNESDDFIAHLRHLLPNNCQIWRAICIDEDGNAHISQSNDIDRYVLDSKVGNQRGGTGSAFDWQKIPHELKKQSMLAGGIGIDNIQLALAQGCLGLDINSSVERQAGVKDHQKLHAVFEYLKMLSKYRISI